MSDAPRCFGPEAAQLCGLIARLLGWRPDHFWLATPAEIAAILTPPGDAAEPLTRPEINRLMERENA